MRPLTPREFRERREADIRFALYQKARFGYRVPRMKWTDDSSNETWRASRRRRRRRVR